MKNIRMTSKNYLLTYLPVAAVGSFILWGCHPSSPNVPERAPKPVVPIHGPLTDRDTHMEIKPMSIQDKQAQKPSTQGVSPAHVAPSQSGSSGSNSPQPPKNLVVTKKTDPNAPAGLPNLGNTCFMNASLQVVAALYADKKVHFSSELKNAIEAINGQYQAVNRELVQAFRDSLWGKGNLGQLANSGNQECAADFLMRLDGTYPFLERWETKSQSYNSDDVCPTWLFDVSTPSPTLDSLPCIALNKIHEFLKTSTVTSKVTDTQRSIVSYASNKSKTLAIWLLRFKQELNQIAQKIDSVVDIPKTMAIPDSISNTIKKNTFALSGLIVHTGGIQSGHYYAYVKRGGAWYWANDDYVKKVNESEAMNAAKTAYLLFYTRTVV